MPKRRRLAVAPIAQGGAALVVGLILLAVLTVLTVAGMNSVTLELLMAANSQYTTQAFFAAEAGIAQALAAGDFSTDPAVSAARFDDLSKPDPTPVAGRGAVIANCPPAASGDRCEYFVRYDVAAGPSPVPAVPGRDDGSLAYHFVIESVGVGGRNAKVALTQGLYVQAMPGEPSSCVIGNPACGIRPVGPPVLTYWRQRGVN
jgi:hypothetical protein